MNHSAFRFKDEDTPIHELDPRAKIVAIAGLSSVLILGELWETVIAGALILSVGIIGKVRLLKSFRETKPILILFLFIFTVHAIFTPGEPLLSIWGVGPTVEGLVRGITVISRLALIVALGFIYSATTHPEGTRLAFEWFLRPFPVDERILGTSASMGIRFFPLVTEEVRRTKEAQKSRCLDANTNILRRLRNVALPLLIRSVKRAEGLSQAMEARLYNAGRTSSVELAVTSRDYAILIAIGSLVISLHLL